MKNIKSFLALVLVCAILVCCMGLIACNSDKITCAKYNEADYSVGNFNYDAKSITKLEVEWYVGNVELIQSEQDELYVTENAINLPQTNQLRYLIENNTLKIKFWKSGYSDTVNPKDKNVTIEIPQNIDIDIKNVSGSTIANDITCKDCDIEGVSGSVQISNIMATKSIEVVTTSGAITATNISSPDVELDSTSGRITTSFVSCTKVEMSTISGNIELNLNGLGATIDFETRSGKYSATGNKKSFGDGAASFEIDTVSGSLTVNEN